MLVTILDGNRETTKSLEGDPCSGHFIPDTMVVFLFKFVYVQHSVRVRHTQHTSVKVVLWIMEYG